MSNKLDNGKDEIYVITGDKDLLQLVSDNIQVCLTRKGVGELDIYDVNNFYEKLGFEPIQIFGLQGIVGDNSDNLPGIKGIGEKNSHKTYK